MQARIKNPAITVPGALEAAQALAASATHAGIPETTLQMVELRAKPDQRLQRVRGHPHPRAPAPERAE